MARASGAFFGRMDMSAARDGPAGNRGAGGVGGELKIAIGEEILGMGGQGEGEAKSGGEGQRMEISCNG